MSFCFSAFRVLFYINCCRRRGVLVVLWSIVLVWILMYLWLGLIFGGCVGRQRRMKCGQQSSVVPRIRAGKIDFSSNKRGEIFIIRHDRLVTKLVHQQLGMNGGASLQIRRTPNFELQKYPLVVLSFALFLLSVSTIAVRYRARMVLLQQNSSW